MSDFPPFDWCEDIPLEPPPPLLTSYPGEPTLVDSMIQATEAPFEGALATYRKYMITATGTRSGSEYGPLPAPSQEEAGAWIYPVFGMWQGWYWDSEITAAREEGFDCLGLEGVRFDSWGGFAGAPDFALRAILSFRCAMHRLRLYNLRLPA